MKNSILFVSTALICFAMPNWAQAACDSNKPETSPASRFEINKTDGTAFDTATKLTWKICPEGQNYSAGHCDGSATQFSWDEAIQTFGDKGDNWRLPNVDELNSIVEGQCEDPAINLNVFPSTPSLTLWSSLTFWSSSSIPPLAWDVNFFGGDSNIYDKNAKFYIRLVRGEQWNDPSGPLEKQSLKDEEKQRFADEKKRLEEAVIHAERNSYITCRNKSSCEKAFSLTQIYINSTASQKIQVATDTIIETYNPIQIGNIGMSAIKTPGKGSSADIRLTVSCKVDDSGDYDMSCMNKVLEIYNGFPAYIKKMLSD